MRYKRYCIFIILFILLTGCHDLINESPGTSPSVPQITDSTEASKTTSQNTGKKTVLTTSSTGLTKTTTVANTKNNLTTTVNATERTASTTALSLSPKEAEQLAGRINNRGTTKNIPSTVSSVYVPVKGASYAHHPHIAYFKNKLYATFSQGRENEDDCGQRIMISVSSDMKTWSAPQPLVDSIMGNDSELVLVNAGLYTDGTRLVAYYGGYEYRKESLSGPNTRPFEDAHRYNHAMYLTYTTDGVNWSKPQKMSSTFSCNYGPLPLKSGRLLMCGGTTFFYTDDKTGLSGFKTRSISTSYLVSQGVKGINEGSFYQMDDGTIIMMFRSANGYLCASVSTDNGDTWSKMYKTSFTDCNSKVKFGRLPDKRFYYIGTPVVGSSRIPLVLSVSSDGINFNKSFILCSEKYSKKFDGLYKGGVYAYPDSVVVNDKMYIIYSKHKEAIDVTTISLADID